MTEAEWLAASKPEPLAEFLKGKVSERKARLLAVASCRRVRHLLAFEDPSYRPGAGLRAIEVSELYADGGATVYELRKAQFEAEHCIGLTEGPQPFDSVTHECIDDLLSVPYQAINNWYWAELIRLRNPYDPHHLTSAAHDELAKTYPAENKAHADLIRDIFNPFRSVVVEPGWLTSTVVALAQGVYADRAFDRLPVLADALMDAGCMHDDILNHCRSEGPHVKGCWVIDLILGKE